MDKAADIIAGRADGMVAMPRLASLAEAVCGQGWSVICADAGQIVPAAKRLAGLFGLPALVLGDDPALADGTGGLDGSRVAVLADAIRRLGAEGGALPVVVLLPGPVAGADAEGISESAKQAFSDALEAICEGRPALLLMDESGADAAALGEMPARRIYNTLRNVAAYFDVTLGALMPSGADAETATRLKLGAALFTGADALPDADSLDELAREGTVPGLLLDAGDTESWPFAAQRARAHGLLVSTRPGGVPTIDMMHNFMRAAKDARGM
ncbi:MAG: hypothetical protein LKF30_12530 [Sphingobium sp.]|jgi:hypothetical protein|nr:hypothetical protein [Sphingobium sp.]MCI1271684.1 hypothetical protein [Sphingobium sp.]MCI1757036.1 hypothetical protein [Sphingobium sp.]MCI2054137.1 hypothetical protein [Sphingobium sp.]